MYECKKSSTRENINHQLFIFKWSIVEIYNQAPIQLMQLM